MARDRAGVNCINCYYTAGVLLLRNELAVLHRDHGPSTWMVMVCVWLLVLVILVELIVIL